MARDSSSWLIPLQFLKATLDLGNRARERRVLTMVEAAISGVGSSIPRLFGVDEEARSPAAKAAQRLLSNALVSLLSLRAALCAVTWKMVEERRLTQVIVAWDPTYVAYNGHTEKKSRFDKKDGFKGYVALNAAVFDPKSGGFLGVAHQTLVSADGPDDAATVDYAPGVTDTALRGEFELASRQQFLIHAKHIDETAPKNLELCFVADREFDDGLALRSLLSSSPRCHFVIRSNEVRALYIEPDALRLPANLKCPSKGNLVRSDELRRLKAVYITDVVSHLPLTYFRALPLDARNRVCGPGRKAARIAHLSVGSIRVLIAKRSQRAVAADLPEEAVWLNLVVVRELAPPEGKKALVWRLLTDLPATTPEELARIVDAYQSRWRTEELFRTEKDVMSLEESRLETPSAIARLLFFFTLKVMVLDQLRAAAGLLSGVSPTDAQRQDIKLAAREAEEIERGTKKQKRTARKSCAERRPFMLLGLLAKLGSWDNRRGAHLGNEILLRGLATLTHDLSRGHYDWLVPDLG